MCAKVGGGVWLGVRLLRVCGSVMESPWLCCVEFAGRQARGCILSGGRCEWAGLFVVGDRMYLHDSARFEANIFKLSQNTTCPRP